MLFPLVLPWYRTSQSLNSVWLSLPIICCAFFQEDTYEAGIANDMRELEMRLEYELEEQEKRWSSEEESGKK
jgi:hypothetical protein